MPIPQHRREAILNRIKELSEALACAVEDADAFDAVLLELRRATLVSPAVPLGFGHYQVATGRGAADATHDQD